jgi:hypothetical protein
VAVVEDHHLKILEDREVADLLFIHKVVLQEIHPQHHHLRVILEEVVNKHQVHQITGAAVAEATADLEEVQVMEMMEHREVEQLTQSQDHL